MLANTLASLLILKLLRIGMLHVESYITLCLLHIFRMKTIIKFVITSLLRISFFFSLLLLIGYEINSCNYWLHRI